MASTGKILLCVTGGIAAYKAIDLASMLHKAGYEVKTLLSQSAMKFVGSISFAAITH
ncbi:MAG: flavoprotein, partial [Candidatus Cloacimonetes bacterium]|nr:flavoprotein [Candidatus Cloacimonadota bacterium]